MAASDRDRGAWGQRIGAGFAVLTSLYHIAYLSHALTYLNIEIMSMPHAGLSLATFLAITFLFYRHKGGKQKGIPWYDLALLLMGALGAGYYFLFYETVADHMYHGVATPVEIVAMFLLLIPLLEGVRRVIGPVLTSVVLFFFIHTFFSNYFPGVLHASGYSLRRVAVYVYMGFGVFSTPMVIASTIVVVFVLFGSFLQVSGGGRFFINLALALLGHIRAGPALSAVLSSALMGMLSGSTVANVATTGVITIPLMKSVGYRPHFAGAVETVASNGGQILPPVMGAVAFIMADWIGMPYITICAFAMAPAILYYLALTLMVIFEASYRKLPRIPSSELPPLGKTLREGWYFFIPLVVLVFFLAVLHYTPQTSALYALFSLVIVSFLRKESRLGPKRILRGLQGGAQAAVPAVLGCAAAGVILGCVSLTGIGVKLSGVLVEVGHGNLAVMLLVTALACFVLGMGMTAVPIYVMLAILVAPALVKLGIIPIVAHLFIYWCGILSYISPPVAVGAFVAASIADASPMRTALTATRLGICTLILPFMFAYNPALVLQGKPIEIIVSLITALITVGVLASGLAGYLLRELNWVGRFLFLLSALILGFMSTNLYMLVAGLVIATSVLLKQVILVWRQSTADRKGLNREKYGAMKRTS